MTCPISCPISCSCQCTDVEPSSSNSASNQSSPSPQQPETITNQPRSSHTISVGDAQGAAGGGYTNLAFTPVQSILDTIRGAGSLVSDLINSEQSQRSFKSCQDYCNEYCCLSAPTWLRCIFSCCCDCLISENTQAPETPNVMVQTIQKYRDTFGPVVLGLAIGYSGINISQRVADNQPLTPEEEQRLVHACQHAQEAYASLIVQSLRGPLVQSAESITPESEEVRLLTPYVLEGLKRTLLGHPVPKHKAEYMIVITDQDTNFSSSSESSSVVTKSGNVSPLSLAFDGPANNAALTTARCLNWFKLYQQLKNLWVCDLTSDDAFPLGSQARGIITVLKHTLNLLSQGDSPLTHPGIGHFIQAPLFLKLLNLVLISSGFIPVQNAVTYPSNLESLKILGGTIRNTAQQSEDTDEADGHPLARIPLTRLAQEIASLAKSDDDLEEEKPGTDEVTSPAAQERLLNTCIRTESIYSIILG